MQIHELNTFDGNTGSAYLVLDDGADTGKKHVDDILDPVKDALNARIDNIIAGGDAPSEAEIIDARLGAPDLGSVAYPSLGAAIRGQVSELYDYMGDGRDLTQEGYWAESWNSAGGTAIYKSNQIVIPAGSTIRTIRYYADQPTYSGYIYLLDSNNTILYKYSGTSGGSGWQTITINKSFDVDAYIAISGLSIKFTWSAAENTPYYSNGLFEAAASENSKGIGDTITFAQNVPTRFYSFGVDVNYTIGGLAIRLTSIENQIDSIDPDIDPSDFIMPLVVKKTGTFTLIGRWFDHRLDDTRFKNCCNCGGQSIMFKVKGATTITADFGQVSRYPEDVNFLMVNEPYMAYSIDGSAFTRVQLDTTNGNTISVPDTDEHFVWIVIDGMDVTTKNGVGRDTGWVGVYIKNLTSDGTLYAVEPKNKQILFVGNSMVEGINTLGNTSTAPSNSAVAEFSFKTAQKLNSIPLLSGYGGTTVWTGVDWARYSFGTTDNNVVTMEPDLIVIEYGHNDYAVISGGIKTEAEFITEYKRLIAILRGMYTGVPIFCLVPFHQYLKSALQTIVSETDFCYLIDTADYSITYSDGTHPNAAGGTSIAESLSEDIIGIMGKSYFID